jgi:hypothetical protein
MSLRSFVLVGAFFLPACGTDASVGADSRATGSGGATGGSTTDGGAGTDGGGATDGAGLDAGDASASCGDGGGASLAGTGLGWGDAGLGLDSGCPAAAPAGGSVCGGGVPDSGAAALECEYGSDPRFTCNVVATCASGQWVIAGQASDCPTTDSPECPATIGCLQQGSACSPNGAYCNYSTTSTTDFCACTGGPLLPPTFQTSLVWRCSSPPANGCPGSRPRLGSTCSQPGITCDYADYPCNGGFPSGLVVACDPALYVWVSALGCFN